jgi:hypothetical protein
VLVRWRAGSFTLQSAFPGSQSAREARKLHSHLNGWLQLPAPDVAGVCPLPPPVLPSLEPDAVSRGAAFWYVAKGMLKLFFAGLLLAPLLPDNSLNILAVLSAPIVFGVAALPVLLKPRPRKSGRPVEFDAEEPRPVGQAFPPATTCPQQAGQEGEPRIS